MTGYYDLVLESDIDIDVYLYYAPFNLNQPHENLHAEGQQNYRQRNIELNVSLTANKDSILVITTHQPVSKARLQVTMDGPSVLKFETDGMQYFLIPIYFYAL